MKRQFYFHRENKPLDADTVIYHVWAGESVRDQRKLTQLMAWAFAHGATLLSWSEDIDFYLEYEEQRVFPGRGLLDFGFIRADISVSEALALATAGNWDEFEKSLSQPKAFFHVISSMEPARVHRESSRIDPIRVPTSSRKYLSQRNDTKPSIIRFI